MLFTIKEKNREKYFFLLNDFIFELQTYNIDLEKVFLLVETIPFSGSRAFQWKPFLLVEAIPFSANCSFFVNNFF